VTAPRILVLAKRTSFRKLVEEDSDPRIKSLLSKGDVTVRRMRRSHEDHEGAVKELRAALAEVGAETIFQEGPRSKIIGQYDLIVTVGGDGTLLSASHQIGTGVPLLGVNSAPEHSVGFFCAAKKGTILTTLRAALGGTLKRTVLTRMRVRVDDRIIHARVLNEALFCHASPAATSRYILRLYDADGKLLEEEEQRSSGLWIGPAAGSTAAQRSAGGRILPLSSQRIQYVVREPYTPYGVPMKLVVGLAPDGGRVELRNKMRESKIFLDGHHNVVDSTIGDVITMDRSDEPLTVLGLSRSPRKGA
jgi:NAD+ kinase